MNIDLQVIHASSLVVVPIIIAIVQAIKMTGWVANKYSPLVSLFVGIIISIIADHTSHDWSNMVLSGAIYGLMASGLYSGLQSTQYAILRQRQQEKNNKS